MLGMNFSFGRREQKVDWRRLGEKLMWFIIYNIDLIHAGLHAIEYRDLNIMSFHMVLAILLR